MAQDAKRQLASRSTCRFAAALAASLCVAAASAQTNLETNSGVRFNFSPPGAPNLALGGAFIGLADDATAAYTNPAGLIKLARPEVTTEVRHWEYEHVYTDRGRLDTPEARALGIPVGLIDGRARDQVQGLSFLSLVYPRERWALALYRHELVNFEARFQTNGALLLPIRRRTRTGLPGDREGRLAGLDNAMSLEVVNYGLAGSRRLGAGFSLGLALSYFQFAIDSRADRVVPEGEPEEERPPVFSPENVWNFQTQRGNDSDWSATVGLRWESAGGVWSAGAVGHRGPSFSFLARSQNTPRALVQVPPRSSTARFRVPHAWGVGLGWRPKDSLRMALDYDRIDYSRLAEDLVDIFGLSALPDPVDPELDRFEIDDANEVHLGLEYFFLRPRVPFSVLLGAWYDPDHSLRFEGENPGFRALFQRRPDQVHYSMGVGFSAPTFQAYGAFDYSDRARVLSLSVVYRLPAAVWHGASPRGRS